MSHGFKWVSVFTGKKYSEHKIFRLGDIVLNNNLKQIFEILEAEGLKDWCNRTNECRKSTKETIIFQDPWTNTKSDNSSFSKRITNMLRQSVNDNGTRKLSLSSVICILEIMIRTFDLKRTNYLIKLITSALLKPWKRSLVLDYLIHMVHIYFLKKKD